ncbi:MAG: lysozyme inhibitor LprI family protein [Acidobacteria bacterium]|nr:lysozyme inhibitor LprI family protein [Acidobacteriota bacterium]MCL5286788.1 lysozyme inhibitor LprI family protein [Acidobacteriota bacterium]
MKSGSRLLILPLLISLSLGFVFAQKPASKAMKKQRSCWDTANTQGEVNACASSEFKEADAELSRLYRELLLVNKEDHLFLQKIEEAQRAWIAYRDAHVVSMYPDYPGNSSRFYGSVLPMCWSQTKTRLTMERVELLKEMLEDIEGDVCQGGHGRGSGLP